ncbi:hypothetical protein SASPL_122908 [Salvia splendens]|uniref:Pentatricopeptide repeat-containing protein n=1 Tax=Salvia splendens TaxID=180675 RepID=A0A8X8ZSH5_SALSN|nr:hypothetical protein SASPL_122908 [Salvia splendens]
MKALLAYCKKGNLTGRQSIHLHLVDKWSFQEKGLGKDGFELFERMQSKGALPDLHTYNSVLDAYCDDGEKLKGSLRDAKRLLFEMTSCGLRPSVITYNLLRDWYCCIGMLEKALYLHDELQVFLLISPTVITYNVMAAGCSRSEDSFRVLEFVVEMEERGISPSKITYTILIDFFAQSNNKEKALGLLAQMRGFMGNEMCFQIFSLACLKSSDQRLSAVNFFNLRHQMERMRSEYFWDFNDLCCYELPLSPQQQSCSKMPKGYSGLEEYCSKQHITFHGCKALSARAKFLPFQYF